MTEQMYYFNYINVFYSIKRLLLYVKFTKHHLDTKFITFFIVYKKLINNVCAM